MLNHKFRVYLKQVCRRITNSERRRQAYRELRSHLQSQLDALIAKDISEQEAIVRILDHAESPRKLGQKLQQAGKPFALRHPIFSTSFALVALSLFALIFAADRASEMILKSIANQSMRNRDAIYQAFENDLKFLDRELNDQDWRRTKNANLFLQKNLSHYTDEEKAAIRAALHPSTEFQYEAATQFARSRNLHLDWLNELVRYDHWNFLSDAKIRSQLERVKQSNSMGKVREWSSMEHPDYQLFADLLKLNVLRHKAHATDARQALEIFIHGARLSGSTSTLIGQMFAASMFKNADELAQMAGIKGEYSRYAAIGAAYRRVSWGWSHIVRSQIFAGQLSTRWEPYAKYKLGLCAGVSENVIAVEGLGDLLYPVTWAEKDLSQDLDQFKQVQASLAKTCGLSELESFQRRSPASTASPLWGREMIELWSFAEPHLHLMVSPARIPFVRRIVAQHLLTQAVPDYITGVYRDQIQDTGK